MILFILLRFRLENVNQKYLYYNLFEGKIKLCPVVLAKKDPYILIVCLFSLFLIENFRE